MVSDPALLEAYRKQLQTVKAAGADPGLVFLGWVGQDGITQDDLIDEYKAAADG